MEELVVFGFIVLVITTLPFLLPIVTWVTARRTRSRVDVLEASLADQARTLETLKGQIAQLRRDMREGAAASPKPAAPPAVEARPVAPEAPPAVRPAAPPVPPPVRPAPAPSDLAAERQRPPAVPPAPRMSPPPASTSDAARKPARAAVRFDWEALVGVKLFAALAGIALVLGAIFFLLYSIEHGWLQPPVRVLIGVAVAVGLLIACEFKAARRYPATANALDAAAIAILFATFFAAHALWDLIPVAVAFGLLAVVTALAVLLSIRRDSMFIALLGLVGGFSTPILLSTGENRPIPLFSYLLLLNVGLAWVAYKKTWPILTLLTLVLTTVYQWGWVFRFLRDAADVSLAMGIFIVFPLVTFAGVLLARRRSLESADDGADRMFERTALASALIPVVFSVYLAAVPAYGARATLLFGFVLLVDLGLLAIAIARRQALLHNVAAVSTLLVLGVWLGVSYVSEARLVTLAFTSSFVLLYLVAPAVAARFGRPFGKDAGPGEYAAPLMLFAFAALLSIEPAFEDPWLLFGPLLLLTLACAWRAIASGAGFVYYLAGFFAVAAQATWAVKYLTVERLGTAVAIFAMFGVASIAVPVAARRLHRPLAPAGGGGLVLFASLFLLLYLSSAPIAPEAIWALALLLAICNAGLFVESAGTRMPALAIAGSVLSWAILAIWWMEAAGAVGVLSSLAVLVGLTLLMLTGHCWGHRRNTEETQGQVGSHRGNTEETQGIGVTRGAGAQSLLMSGLFLGLGGHLFLFCLALSREWSLPPWPLFGALAVMTLATSAAALYARAPVLHAAGVVAAAAVVGSWASAATTSPWPLAALAAAAMVSAYGLLWMPVFAKHGGGEMATGGAVGALYVGQATAIIVGTGPERAHLAAVVAAHVLNLATLLALTWRFGSRSSTLVVALVGAVGAFAWSGGWHGRLALSAAIYVVFAAFPLILGRRVGEQREPFVAAIIASAAFFVAGREALVEGGYESIVGALPVLEALVLALLLRQLLTLETPGARDLGRLALVAGSALAFVTVAIPLQLEHQWITIAWALEGAALAWLFTRVPHRGVLYFSLALLAAAFVRLALNPDVFRYEPRGELRILNWYLYTYVVAAGSMLVSARWYRRTDEQLLAGMPKPSQLLPAAAGILLFLLLNIEIADYYATGPEITFRFGVRVSQDLTYTIGWLMFGIGVLATGIYFRNQPARVAAVAMIAITAFKCFLWDLREFGGLYRVGSLVGLAIALALVSLALQKYVLSKPADAR